MKSRQPDRMPMSDVKPHALPSRVESLDGLPPRLHPLYERDYSRESSHVLTPIGKILSRHRQDVAADPLGRPPPVRVAGQVPRVAPPDWSLLVGCATPEERVFLLSEAAAGRIKVKKT